MSVETSQSTNLSVKLIHSTKQQSPNDPVKLVFSINDEQGVEEVMTAEVPDSVELFEWCQEQGYILSNRRGSSSIQQLRRKAG